MGQGARTVFAQIAAQELGAPLDWVTVVMGDTAIVPVRPADLGQPLDGADGQLGPGGLPRRSRRSCGRWRPGSTASTRRRSPWTRASSACPTASSPSVEVLQARPRPAGRRAHRQRRDAQGRRARTTRCGGSARVLRVQLHGHRGRGGRGDRRHRRSSATSPSPTWARPSTRSRSGCRTRARRSGPRPHAHGALHLRRRAAGSGTSAPSTTGSRPAWTCRSSCISEIVENADGPGPVRLQGHERGRAAVRRPGRRRPPSARRPASRSATCRSRRSASGGRCRSGRPASAGEAER